MKSKNGLRPPASVTRFHSIAQSSTYKSIPVMDRVKAAIDCGLIVRRVRHYGSAVGQLHKLKSGEQRLALDCPAGKYRTAWCVVQAPLEDISTKLSLFIAKLERFM